MLREVEWHRRSSKKNSTKNVLQWGEAVAVNRARSNCDWQRCSLPSQIIIIIIWELIIRGLLLSSSWYKVKIHVLKIGPVRIACRIQGFFVFPILSFIHGTWGFQRNRYENVHAEAPEVVTKRAAVFINHVWKWCLYVFMGGNLCDKIKTKHIDCVGPRHALTRATWNSSARGVQMNILLKRHQRVAPPSRIVYYG